MAYSSDVDSGIWAHEVRFAHTPTGVVFYCRLDPFASAAATEGQRDAVFQALVSKIAELPNTTIVSATKTTHYTSECTP